jgi:hypothetical protein
VPPQRGRERAEIAADVTKIVELGPADRTRQKMRRKRLAFGLLEIVIEKADEDFLAARIGADSVTHDVPLLASSRRRTVSP